jgi:flagellar biogenesis protein FliO
VNSTLGQRCLVAAAMLVASASSVLADNVTAPVSHAGAGSILFSLVRMIGALALVFAFFAGGLWLFKNWQRLVGRPEQAAKLNVLEVRSIGHRQTLYVVGYEQQRLLLASSPAGITMLTSLPEADEDGSAIRVAPKSNFTDVFLHALGPKS